MEIKWLEDFICLYQLRSFRRSANQRAVSQSAFSRRIKALEQWIGADLIDRSCYPVELTQAGHDFIETAKQITSTAYQAKVDASSMHRESTDRLIIATHPSLAVSFVPQFLKNLNWPKIRPIYKIRNDLKTAEDYLISLEHGTCDYLICYQHPILNFQPEPELFISKKIKQETLLPVVSSSISKSILKKEIPLVQYSAYTNLGKIVSHSTKNNTHSHRFKIVAEASVAETIKAMVMNGHGLAWLPESYIAKELNDGLLTVMDEFGKIKINIQLICYKSPNNEIKFLWDQLD